MIELVVTADIPEAATDLFITVAPRTIALAGGKTPLATYSRLATVSYEWAQTEVFFGDERCVPPDHVDSNYRGAWETLLSKVPAVVHRMPGEACDAAAYEHALEETFGRGMPRFDLVFLGLGSDGHTASLFPNDPALNEQSRRVVRVDRPDHSRITLTLQVLSRARVAVFLVSGQAKRQALGQLLRGADIPAARINAERVVVIADEAAGGVESAS